MSDVFLSYASPDRASAQELARKLEECHLTVLDMAVDDANWIKPLTKAIKDTQIVLVMWSSKLPDWSREVCMNAEANQKQLFVAYTAGSFDLREPFLSQRRSMAYDVDATEPFGLLVEAVERTFLTLPTVETPKPSAVGQPIWLDYSVDDEWDISSWLEKLPPALSNEALRADAPVAETSLVLTVRDYDLSNETSKRTNGRALTVWMETELSKHDESRISLETNNIYIWLGGRANDNDEEPKNLPDLSPGVAAEPWIPMILPSAITSVMSDSVHHAFFAALERVETDLSSSVFFSSDRSEHQRECMLEVRVNLPNVLLGFRLDLPGTSRSDLQSVFSFTQALRFALQRERKITE